ncbi:hemerythrin domain-containing protein [Marichromatium sp. AB31]|uniref:hemerythrin domain-containing protein n=1 Tax=Marichromatium sp. AB31 TaxID=2483362 RepID=UPI000F3DB9AB|nr:hemerythrin domain-containing protein [Marichromatium sp. AB31]RNE90387.1 hemerythrin domain-containing protein [Marichromatium sp. AB31]
MQTLDTYRDSHAELRQMIDDLRALLAPELLRIRPNARTAHQLLCDFGQRVRAHLAEEDRSLYPGLLIHEDPRAKSIAWGFISGEKPLRQAFSAYHKRWLKDCDFEFCETFLAQTHEILEMVSARIDREEQVLLPKLVEAGILQEAAAGR